MQPRAIIYCSKHGATKEYAHILGKKYGLPVIDLSHISGYSFQNIPVIFCGWVKNGVVQGLSKANKLFMSIEVIAIGSYPFNEGYQLKLQYKNEIIHGDFKYVQSAHPIHVNVFEKAYLSLFQPKLLETGKVKYSEYTI